MVYTSSLESRMGYSSGFDVVTGAFDYTGKHITEHLLNLGRRVKTITRHPERRFLHFQGAVEILPYFDKGWFPGELLGAETIYNTHWVRFDRDQSTFQRAIANTRRLIDAAKEAGVEKIVHISVSNAGENSHFPYFDGKYKAELLVRDSGLSYAILRPSIIFGPEEILLNNIAYLISTLHLFPIPGDGAYKVQPVFVDDLAAIAIKAAKSEGNLELDIAGPEDYTFNDLISLIKKAKKTFAWTPHTSREISLACAKALEFFWLRDRLITEDELGALMSGLLESHNPARGSKSLREWLLENPSFGSRYAHELSKHYSK